MSQLDPLLLAIFWILTMFGMGTTLSISDLAKVMR
jgi:predicted Na+-dependent transporter